MASSVNPIISGVDPSARATAELPQSWIFWAAIGAGISYMIPVLMYQSGPAVTAWKGAGVGLLAAWAARNAWNFDGRLIAFIMGIGALADVVLDIAFLTGGTIFAVGHMVAIYFYIRNRRSSISNSQALLAAILVPLGTYIAWSMPYENADASNALIYTLFVTAMAAAAWVSRFPRYRTGLGAMLFVTSDLFIFSRFGPLEGSSLPDYFVWPLYFFGQALIVWGVVDTLTRETEHREQF